MFGASVYNNNNMKKILLLKALLCTLIVQVFGQDSLVISSLASNKYAFDYNESKGFSGIGWDSIVTRATKNQYTLIGEIHGTKEVPLFLNALVKQVKFETFVAEIDPYLSTIMQEKLKSLSSTQLQKWQKETAGNLSFYSYQNDFELLKTLQASGIAIRGIDQITALNDAPIYLHLSELTKDRKKKQIYLKMAKNAQQMLSSLTTDPKKLPYLMSAQFESDLKELKAFKLSSQEQDIVEKLEYSRGIYTSRSGHQKRIKLMKNQLMNQYSNSLKGKKALFRLGANHSTKGESLLTIFDIGNLAHNLAESQFNSSYHLAIYANSGEAGNPFKGNPNTEVKLPKELTFITTLTYDGKWTYFDLKPLRKQIESGKLKVENEFIKRIIKGYDGLVVIPKATAGEHF